MQLMRPYELHSLHSPHGTSPLLVHTMYIVHRSHCTSSSPSFHLHLSPSPSLSHSSSSLSFSSFPFSLSLLIHYSSCNNIMSPSLSAVSLILPSLPGVLTIPGASVEDSGVYVCTASGVQGTFTLSVMEQESGQWRCRELAREPLYSVCWQSLSVWFYTIVESSSAIGLSQCFEL